MIDRRALISGGVAAGALAGAADAGPPPAASLSDGGVLEAEAHGLVGDGATDNTAALARLLGQAVASGRLVQFSGPGDYRIDGRIAITLTGPLRVRALAGARLLLARHYPNAFELTADTRLEDGRLAEDAGYGALAIKLAAKVAPQPGDVVTLSTRTQVCRTYPGYHKIHTGVVLAVDGQTALLREPLPFPFSAAETTVTVYKPAVLSIDGLGLKMRYVKSRFDLWGIGGARIENCTFEGTGSSEIGVGLFVARCVDLYCRNTDVRNVIYGIMLTAGTRNSLIERVRGSNCYHPIDPNLWAHGVVVRDLVGVGNAASINSHPAFEVWYDGVRDYSDKDASMSLRSIGGGVRNARLEGRPLADGVKPRGSVATVGLLPEYEFLAETATCVFENVHAPTAMATASECAHVRVVNSTFASIAIDGHSNKVGSIEIVNSKGADRMRRIKRIAGGAAMRLPLTRVEEGGAIWFVANVKDDINLGYHPKLRYFVETAAEPAAAGQGAEQPADPKAAVAIAPAALSMRLPFRLYHHYGIHEERRRTGVITATVIADGLFSSRRFQYDSTTRGYLTIDRHEAAGARPDGTGAAGANFDGALVRLSIDNPAAAAEPQTHDRFYLEFELAIAAAKPLRKPRVRLEVEEERW